MMKRAGFIAGYAGGILALICALLMLYTVPAGIADSVVQGIGSDLENEHIVTMGEMFAENDWPSLSRGAFEDFASQVADDSRLPIKDNVYQQSALFLYRAELNMVVSAVIVVVSIVMAFIAFFGSLSVRKRPMAAGVMMLVSALVLLVASIYTGTAMPMTLACLLLAAGGIIAFIPEKAPPARAGIRPYSPPDFPEDDIMPTRMNREREAPKDKINVRVRRDDSID
jgi:hypothetical protein